MQTPNSRTLARRVATLLTTAMAVLAAVLMAAPAQATFPGKIGLILFTRGGDLYTANSSGGAITRLTTVGQIGGPKWSPSGKTIAYRRGTTIYTRSYPGGVTTTVATGALGDPQWSPDGSRIAYIAAAPSSPCGEVAVWTSPAAGGTPAVAWDDHDDACPGLNYVGVWTLGGYMPDGRGIIGNCASRDGDGCGVGFISMDGTTNSFTRIFDVACYPDDPSNAPCSGTIHVSDARVGPAGNAIYFSGKGGYDTDGAVGTLPGSTPNPTTSTLERPYAISPSGTNLHSVTTATSGYSISRAPTGSTILFVQKSGTTTNILKASSDSATAKATTFITNASQPDWQPAS